MILALDTSGGELLLALVDGPTVLAGLARPGSRQQAFIRDAIAEVAGGRLGDVDAIVVSRGPGSHTGLRVGLSAAEGLAYARRLRIHPISSLEVAAHRAPDGEGVVQAVVGAGRGRVFVQEFDCDGGRRIPRGERVLRHIDEIDADDAIIAAEPELMEMLAPASSDGHRGGADALAAAAIQAADGGEGVNYDQLKGDYGD